MGCPPGHKKVAVVKRWPLVEIRLYIYIMISMRKSFQDYFRGI